jgi:hypothetical protein
MEDMRQHEKNRLFGLKLKENVNLEDLKIFKEALFYIFGKGYYKDIFFEFLSLKRVSL